MNWKKIKTKDDGSYILPSNWLFVYYYEALNILFRFENSLRVFVYLILKNEFQDRWTGINFTVDGVDQSIQGIAKKRIHQAKTFGYLGYEMLCPIMHLTSGELIEIITSENYWKHFANYFMGSKEIMKNKLLEISSIRNSIAHFRPIKEDDVAVIKQNVNQTLMGIEKCLNGLVEVFNYVPTNCEESWYKELSTIGSENINFSFRQNKTEEWIKLYFTFYPVIVKKDVWGENNFHYYLTNLISPKIIEEYSNIGKFTTFLDESVPRSRMKDKGDPKFVKYLAFIFRRKCLSENYTSIGEDFKTLINDLAKEIELLRNDHLAKGKILETVSASAFLDSDAKWNISKEQLVCNQEASHPVEYWKMESLFPSNFVTEIERFPWMLTDISKSDFPF